MYIVSGIKDAIIPNLPFSFIEFQKFLLFWLAEMILEACDVEFKWVYSFAITPYKKEAFRKGNWMKRKCYNSIPFDEIFQLLSKLLSSHKRIK